MGRILLRSADDALRVLAPDVVLSRNTIGDNAGNLIFRGAAQAILETAATRVVADGRPPGRARAEEINERYDAYVLPLANAFRPSHEARLKSATALISRLRIPVVVLGVGHHATVTNDWSQLDSMAATTKAFVSAVLDHGPTIGVRGELTMDYLRALGFRDAEVIGCPSMFAGGPELRIRQRAPSLKPDATIALTVSPYRSRMTPIVNRHAERYPNLTYIAQDLDTLELLVWGRMTKPVAADDPRPIHPGHRLFREDRVRFFVAPQPWLDFLATQQFTFGSRIHGAMASLLAGTPAFVLAHDARTLELATYFGIPHRLLRDVDPRMVDAAELYRDADPTPLLAGHAERFARFVSFLDAHGLDHVFRSPAPEPDFATRAAAAAWPPAVRVSDGEPRRMQHGVMRHALVRLRRRLKRWARSPWLRRARVRLSGRG